MQLQKIRLLKLVTNFKIGGTERQVANVALRLDSSRFELHLGSLRRHGELLKDLEALDVPQPEFQIGKFYDGKTFLQAARFARYIRRNLIQVVHSYGFYSNVFAVPAARMAGRCVVVASIRDTGEVITPMQRRVQKAVCRMADCVLVNAEAIRRTLIEQGYRPETIFVIRNGIMLSRFAAKQNGHLLRSQLGLPASAQLVAVSSRLNRMKGIEYFLDAAAILAPKFPDVAFLVVGDGDIRQELEEHARRVGVGRRVIFTGFRSDVPELLSEVAVSVLPSLSEGLSNSLLESMAAGVPVVATRVGGNPEVIEDGVTGWLVPARDPASMAEAIGRLLEDREQACRFGQNGRRRVAELFSIERAVQETERLYSRLVEAKLCA